MNANRESEIRSSVRGAVTKLATGSVSTLTDLFGKITTGSADYGRALTVLKRLVDGMLIIASERGAPGEPRLYQARNPAELQRIASDEFELSRLIWPGRTPPKRVSVELIRALKVPENVEDGPIAAGQFKQPTPTPEPTNNETIAGILKLLGAVVENVIYIREKIDALDSVACSHCEYPEAHRAG